MSPSPVRSHVSSCQPSWSTHARDGLL